MFNRPDAVPERQEPRLPGLPALGAGFPVGQNDPPPPARPPGGGGGLWWLAPLVLFRKAGIAALLAIVVLFPLEIAARFAESPPWWRPATLLGSFSGEVQNAFTKAHTEGQVALTDQLKRVESDYNDRVAAIQAHYQAQLADFQTRIQQKAQEEVAIVQARLEQTTEAYKAAYQKANQLAAAGAEVAKVYEQMRVSLADRNTGGQVFSKNVADLLKGFALLTNNPQLYARSDGVSRAVQAEMTSEVKGAVSDLQGVRLFTSWNQGLPLPDDLAMQMTRATPPRFETNPALPPSPAVAVPPGRLLP